LLKKKKVLKKPPRKVLFLNFKKTFFKAKFSFSFSDVEKTVNFLSELRELTLKHSSLDGLDRLFLLEMVEGDLLTDWGTLYRNETLSDATVPFSFGQLPLQTR